MATEGFKSDIELYVINKVREMRTARNVSQAELALKLGLSVGFIGHIESPKHRAKYNLNHINELAKVFGCSVKDFLPDIPF
ncbi:helix-turn-helix domain-containing protein [Olivibacter sitiensis]|uniref:helix-turn-helix domain-containing protein n=1 Tax=Olivibacter sitiensis TaxID=376470 RepID=UPI0003F4C2A1|nr:helix-turn-helix transcriptional regulator [Olivibacter sitiensis]